MLAKRPLRVLRRSANAPCRSLRTALKGRLSILRQLSHTGKRSRRSSSPGLPSGSRFEQYHENIHRVCDSLYNRLNSEAGTEPRLYLIEALKDALDLESRHHVDLVLLGTFAC
jgi:hypothetical protein